MLWIGMSNLFNFHPDSDSSILSVGDGQHIAYRMIGATSPDVLVICFHGAINREKSSFFPKFQKAFNAGTGAAFLSIADPTLQSNEGLRLGWYSGSESFPVRSILKGLIKNTVTQLKPRRTIFFGSSGGGYAALLYASSIDGAVSLTINPQTDILSYWSGHVEDYFASCWPRVPKRDRRNSTIVCDLSELYQDNAVNVTSVMLSSPGDRQHFVNHISKFIGKIGRGACSRLILASNYFGIWGHGGSIPPDVIRNWYIAIILAETTEPESILTAFSGLASKISSPSTKSPKDTQLNSALNQQNILFADVLRDYHLLN
jgi:hypothetical protein